MVGVGEPGFVADPPAFGRCLPAGGNRWEKDERDNGKAAFLKSYGVYVYSKYLNLLRRLVISAVYKVWCCFVAA